MRGVPYYSLKIAPSVRIHSGGLAHRDTGKFLGGPQSDRPSL